MLDGSSNKDGMHLDKRLSNKGLPCAIQMQQIAGPYYFRNAAASNGASLPLNHFRGYCNLEYWQYHLAYNSKKRGKRLLKKISTIIFLIFIILYLFYVVDKYNYF
jgi:hypothetical protein